MQPFAVRRFGSGHDRTDGDGPLSASALRARLYAGEPLSEEIPAEAAAVFEREIGEGRALLRRDALELPILARLRALDEAAFLSLPDAGDGLGRRLFRAVQEGSSLEEIHEAVRTKRYALARIRRLCLCACLGIKTGMADGVPPYARVLAANAQGRALLRERSDMAAIPILTKPAAVRGLSGDCEALFTLGARAHDFYVLGFPASAERRPGEDWRTSPVMR